MSFKITVSDVRRQIWFAAGSTGTGERATKLLGQIFHELFAQLVGNESACGLDRILDEASLDLELWKTLVRQAAYRNVVFPRIQANRHVLPEMSAELLTFWKAARAMCDWLCELRWNWTEGGEKSRPPETWILAEQPLNVSLHQSNWSDRVELGGIADALIRRPDGAWCVVELKMGQAAPEADLAQACLYHLMQMTQDDSPPIALSALALVQFGPEKQEMLYSAEDVAKAQEKLLDLIGEMMQQAGPASPSPTPPQKPKPKPTPVSASTLDLGRQIVKAFAQYGVSLEIDGEPIVGPTFVRFPLRLGRGVKKKKVEGLNSDIKVVLGLEADPFIHYADDRMVIDVQRNKEDRQTVSFEDVLDQFPKRDPELGSPQTPIGVNLNGDLEFLDFSDSGSPHVLVAGTTSSGKSEWLISAIAGLNLLNTPETLRYVLIDPKRNAFTWMKKSAFLFQPIVFPGDKDVDVVEVFESLVTEMERRYALFDGDSDLQSYVKRTGKTVPRLICICDEFFDLLASSPATKKEIETKIARLGSKARAAGIHLILATQQPSRRVISGILDTNIPARIGLKTSKSTESQMLLGEKGAENLLGKGDLLFKAVESTRRFQGLYIPEDQRARYAGPPGAGVPIR